MKIDHRTTLWRGRSGRLWRLADLFVDIADAIRYAKKPHDLVYPITRLTDLTNQARDMMWEWLAKILNMDPKDKGRWPRL